MANTFDKDENDYVPVVFSFTQKTVLEHLADYLKLYLKQLPKLFTILLTGWALTEIIFYERETAISDYIMPLMVISVCITLFDNYNIYKINVPNCLIAESEKVKRIFTSQKISWQYQLAYEILSSRIQRNELRLDRIKRGADFVKPQIISECDYVEYLKLKPITLSKLAKAIKVTCLEILQKSLEKVKSGNESDIYILINELESLSILYDQVVIFETGIYEIIPPEKYEELHRYLFDWTETLRDAVCKFLDIIKMLSKIRNKRDLTAMSSEIKQFTIDIDSPKNLKIFNELLEQFN